MSCWRPLVMSDITQGELIWQSLQQLPFLSGSQSGCWHLIQLQTPVSRYLNTTQAVFMTLQGPSPSLFRWPLKVYSYCSFFVGSLLLPGVCGCILFYSSHLYTSSTPMLCIAESVLRQAYMHKINYLEGVQLMSYVDS